MKWYLKPVAAIGAAHIAYHEVLRGRRTGTCMECGRLTHASAERCLCGGDVEENEHAEETLDEIDVPPGDSFEKLSWRIAVPTLWLAWAAASLFLMVHAVQTGSLSAGIASVAVTAVGAAVG